MFYILEITILILLGGWFLFFIIQAYNIFFKGYAPFVASKKQAIKDAIKEINLDETKTVYELGCGQAGFLHAIRRKFPKTKLVGFEYAFLPIFLAKIQNWLLKSNIEIIKKDIFKVNLAEADLVYCYLNPKMMNKLKNKFKNEMKSGAQIISFEFLLSDWQPSKVIESDGAKIYFYNV